MHHQDQVLLFTQLVIAIMHFLSLFMWERQHRGGLAARFAKPKTLNPKPVKAQTAEHRTDGLVVQHPHSKCIIASGLLFEYILLLLL